MVDVRVSAIPCALAAGNDFKRSDIGVFKMIWNTVLIHLKINHWSYTKMEMWKLLVKTWPSTWFFFVWHQWQLKKNPSYSHVIFFLLWSFYPHHFDPQQGPCWHSDTGQIRGPHSWPVLASPPEPRSRRLTARATRIPTTGGARVGWMKSGRQRENNTWMINNFFVLKEKKSENRSQVRPGFN